MEISTKHAVETCCIFLSSENFGLILFFAPSTDPSGKHTIDCLSEGGVKRSMKPYQNVVAEG